MQAYWITFEDGSQGCCEGQSNPDAKCIAEKITGKTISGPKYHDSPNVVVLPYPASPVIWQFDHPVDGKTPRFCYRPNECKGKACCDNNPSCTS